MAIFVVVVKGLIEMQYNEMLHSTLKEMHLQHQSKWLWISDKSSKRVESEFYFVMRSSFQVFRVNENHRFSLILIMKAFS